MISSYVKIYVTDDFSGGASLHVGVEVRGANGPYTDKRYQVDYYPSPQGRYVGLTSGGFSGHIYEVEVYPTGKIQATTLLFKCVMLVEHLCCFQDVLNYEMLR